MVLDVVPFDWRTCLFWSVVLTLAVNFVIWVAIPLCCSVVGLLRRARVEWQWPLAADPPVSDDVDEMLVRATQAMRSAATKAAAPTRIGGRIFPMPEGLLPIATAEEWAGSLNYHDTERVLTNAIVDAMGVEVDGVHYIDPNADNPVAAGFRSEFLSDEEDDEEDRESLLREVSAYAERLVAAGDLDAMEAAFGSRDPNFNVASMTTDELWDVRREYIED